MRIRESLTSGCLIEIRMFQVLRLKIYLANQAQLRTVFVHVRWRSQTYYCIGRGGNFSKK